MSRHSFSEFACSLARTVDIIGDTWTPLVLRDIHLGVDTFDEIVRDLGIPRALLSGRLATLTRGGVVTRKPYSERADRFRYQLTDAGSELVPLLVGLTQWGDRWRSPGGAPIVFEHSCGAHLDAVVCCAACGEPVTDEDVTAVPGPGGRARLGTLVVAERLLAAAQRTDGAP